MAGRSEDDRRRTSRRRVDALILRDKSATCVHHARPGAAVALIKADIGAVAGVWGPAFQPGELDVTAHAGSLHSVAMHAAVHRWAKASNSSANLSKNASSARPE